MASLDRVVAAVQEKATNVLTSYYRSQSMVSSYLIRVTLWIEALQIIAIGLLASQEEVVIRTVGFLIVPAVSTNGIDAASHGIMFWFAFTAVLTFSFGIMAQVLLASNETSTRVGLFGKVIAYIVLLGRRILLPFCVATIVQGLSCHPDGTGGVASSASAMCSDASLRTVIAAVSGTALGLSIIITAIMELCVFDIDLLSMSPIAASHGRAQAMFVVVKCIAAAIMASGPDGASPALLSFVAVLLGVLALFAFGFRAPYARRSINCLYVGAGAGAAWGGATGLLPLVSSHIGTLMPATFGTALASATAFVWTMYVLESISKVTQLDGSGGMSAFSVWAAMMWVRDKLRMADAERRKENAMGFSREARKAALEGTAMTLTKPKTSVIEDLVASTSALSSITSQGGVTAAAASSTLSHRSMTKAEMLEKEALLGVAYIEDTHSDNALAQIIVSRFWHLLFSLSHFKERQALTTAKSLSSSFDVRFFFAVCMDAIRSKGEDQGAHPGGNHSSAKDIFDRVRFEIAHEAAISAMLSAYEAQNEVMKLVTSGVFDFGHLHSQVALGFGEAMKKAHTAVEEMLSVNSDSSEALSLATEFYSDLAGDAQRSTELNQRNNRLLDQQRRQAERKVQHLAFGAPCEELSPTDETNAVFTIATEPSRLGEITAFNGSACKLFKRKDFLGQNINIIIPQPIAGVHDRFLQRFLRTGTARLLDSTRFLVARSNDATIFPVRFRLFETPPSIQDVRPKLTGIIGYVNSDEGFIIVGDQSLEFVVTGACARSCELIGYDGHEIERGATTGVELFPELFAQADEDHRPSIGMHLRQRRNGARSVAHGGASVAHRSRSRVDKSGALEGVPEWAMEMPRRLQTSFSKPTRVHMFPPKFDSGPDEDEFESPRIGMASARGAGRKQRPRRPSADMDILGGLLSEDGPEGAESTAHPAETAPQPHHQQAADAVPMMVRCYAMPKPVPTDPAGVLVCWTRRDLPGKTAGGPASRKPKVQVRMAVSERSSKTSFTDPVQPSVSETAKKGSQSRGEAESKAHPRRGAPGGGVMFDRGARSPGPSKRNIAVKAPSSPGGAAGLRELGQGGGRRQSDARGSVTGGGDGKSMSSFSSISARKAARRRVESLARHKSPAASCLKYNTLLSGIISLAVMLTTLLITGATSARVSRHEASIVSALELVRVTEFSSLVVHSVASAAEASRLHNASAAAPSLLDIAYGDAYASYSQWPVTSFNASFWRLQRAPELLFSSSRTMTAAARNANPAEYAFLTEPDFLCVRRESPDELIVPGHFPLQLQTLDGAGGHASGVGHQAAANAAYRNNVNCTGVSMAVSDTIDASIANLERIRDNNFSDLSPRDFSVRFVVENGEAVMGQAVNDTVEGAIVAMVSDLASVLDVQMLIVFIASMGFFLGQLIFSVCCARRLASEQRVILKVLFSMPKPIAKAVNASAVQHYRDLKARRAAFQSPEGRADDELDADNQLHSDDSGSESDDQVTVQTKSTVGGGLGAGGAGSGGAGAGAGAGAGGRGTGGALRRGQNGANAQLLDSEGVENGDRAALATAVASSAGHGGVTGKGQGPAGASRWTRGVMTPAGTRFGGSRGKGLPRAPSSGSETGSDAARAAVEAPGPAKAHPVGVKVVASNSRKPFSIQPVAQASSSTNESPRSEGEESPGGDVAGLLDDATGLRSSLPLPDTDRRGSMQSLTSFAEQTAPGAARAAIRQADEASARAADRKVRVTDKTFYVARAGLCTVVPTMLVVAWFISMMITEAVLHGVVIKDIERVAHALELSVWISKHAHSFGWGVVDPSTQGPGNEETRAALLNRFAEERDAIEFRMGLLLHGGVSSLEHAIAETVDHGWLDFLSRSDSLPAADPTRRTFQVLTSDACTAVIGASANAYYNSEGRNIITPELCATVHDGVLARGLTTAVSRLLSRSRSLEAALSRLWSSQANLRLVRSDPAAAAAAQVNVTADEATVIEADAAARALFTNLLQLVDPWLRLAAADLGLFLSADLTDRVMSTWTLQRDITIVSGSLVVLAIILVIIYALDSVQAAVRSARRLLHFLPESAYKQPAVAEALDMAFASIGIHMVV